MAKNIHPEFDFPRLGGTIRGAREFFDAETVVDADVFVAATATVKRWNGVPTLKVGLGTSWTTKPLKQFNGVSWVPATLKRYRP